MHPFLKVPTQLLAVLSASCLLVACGSGNSDGDDVSVNKPNAAAITAAISTKALNLTWLADVDAQHYHVYVDLDGSSGFTNISGSIIGQSYSVPLSVHDMDWNNARFMVEACNSGGCTPSTDIFVSGNMLDAIGYVKAATNTSTASFGFGLALSKDGTTLAVGTPRYDSTSDGTDNNSGAVFLYTATGNDWTYQSTITNPSADLGADDLFGYSVALSDDGATLAIGSPYDDGAGTGVIGPFTFDGLNGPLQNTNSSLDSGAAYLYSRDNDNWSQQAYIKASNADARDYFGVRVAISQDGSRLAVSSPYEASVAEGINGDATDNSTRLAGAVYLFDYTDSASEGYWSQSAYIKPSTNSVQESPCFDPLPPGIECTPITASRFGFGIAFANNGNTLAVGAPGDNSSVPGINVDEFDLQATSSGAVYILNYVDNAWLHSDYIKASNPEIDDEFGYSLTLDASGTQLAVGAPYEDSNGTGLDSDTQSDNSREDSGAVYAFTRVNGSWSQTNYIKPTFNSSDDFFGWDLALSGDGQLLAIGNPKDASSAVGIGSNADDNSESSAGAVYVYRNTNQVWQMLNYVKASNTGTGDIFGRRVVLSEDGATMAVSATGEDSAAIEINGDTTDNSESNSGAVYLY